ncbi:MAG: 30S ribosomal protein S18 [Dehalococcoidia bacterium]|nr:30S ribosomal protein S18 [Dehalococcoidia bacterium]MDP7232412.1 30S ribosomal protein S18 [Dehalococcoidia bacterium]MDP7612606.1 30S ribosomal protein S18 [Dehalococcoidia bacterium]
MTTTSRRNNRSNSSNRSNSRPFRHQGLNRRRECFCKTLEGTLDFKDVSTLRRFITDRGKIVPARRSGNCVKHQRVLNLAIKRARFLALLPYAPNHSKTTRKIAAEVETEEKPKVESAKDDVTEDVAAEVETEEKSDKALESLEEADNKSSGSDSLESDTKSPDLDSSASKNKT